MHITEETLQIFQPNCNKILLRWENPWYLNEGQKASTLYNKLVAKGFSTSYHEYSWIYKASMALAAGCFQNASISFQKASTLYHELIAKGFSTSILSRRCVVIHQSIELVFL